MVDATETAPFRDDLADSPPGGLIYWRKTADGVRLRLGVWHAADPKGTILLFNGRTEYLEKYGPIIGTFLGAGLSVISLDWRGQGMSDRVHDNDALGHVHHFDDYQLDVDVLMTEAAALGLPKPWNLIGHSMGGCIGLRTLSRDLGIDRAVFSAPMWRIELSPVVRPLSYIVPPLARLVGAQYRFAPGTKSASYVTDASFEENMLTTDPDTYQWLARQVTEEPRFAIGGPSIHWIGAATQECDALLDMPRPNVPVLTFLGTREEIVSKKAIRTIHANWPTGELREVDGAKHEVMMEANPMRQQFIDETLAFFGC